MSKLTYGQEYMVLAPQLVGAENEELIDHLTDRMDWLWERMNEGERDDAWEQARQLAKRVSP
jgi:hypothetical protein